jgi:hypothetical protein
MWHRRSKTESDAVRDARDVATSAALQREQVEANAPAARAIGTQIRNALERNHFGEQIQNAWLLRRGRS